MFAFNGPESTNSTADVGAGIRGQVFRKLPFTVEAEPRVTHGFRRSGNGVMNKGAHLARLFLGDEFKGIEVLDFGGDFDRKPFGIKLLDVVDATATVHQCSPCSLD